MMIAQRLYEGVELGEEGSVGLITYMRTDSTRVSNESAGRGARVHYVAIRQGLPAESARTSTKRRRRRRAAHEAIRPTSAIAPSRPDQAVLKEDEFKVYKLIWQRLRGLADHARGLRSDQPWISMPSRAPTLSGSA